MSEHEQYIEFLGREAAARGYTITPTTTRAVSAQSRRMSFVESITNSFVGFWISVVLAMWTVPWLYMAINVDALRKSKDDRL